MPKTNVVSISSAPNRRRRSPPEGWIPHPFETTPIDTRSILAKRWDDEPWFTQECLTRYVTPEGDTRFCVTNPVRREATLYKFTEDFDLEEVSGSGL